MKLARIFLILFCGSVLVSPDAAAKPEKAKKPPYKVHITLPAGFAADDDPFMATAAYYVFATPENMDTGTKTTLRFLKVKASQTDSAVALQAEQAKLRGYQQDYSESAPYQLTGKQVGYTCVDWRGSGFGNDFAGFVCAASFEGNTILVEASDLVSNSATSLPQLKDSLKAATYSKG